MKKWIPRLFILILAVALAISLCVIAYADQTENEITVLFTNDLHSHLLPKLDLSQTL